MVDLQEFRNRYSQNSFGARDKAEARAARRTALAPFRDISLLSQDQAPPPASFRCSVPFPSPLPLAPATTRPLHLLLSGEQEAKPRRSLPRPLRYKSLQIQGHHGPGCWHYRPYDL